MATYEAQTGQSIQEAFEKFHKQNPNVYDLFKKYVKQILIQKGGWTKEKGLKPNFKTSPKMIFNRLRWEIYMETNSDDGYRINDAFISRYARKFANDYPVFKDIFNYRDLRS